MPLEFSVKVAGVEELRLKLPEIPIRDWGEWWWKAIANLKGMLRPQFGTEGARGPTGKWAALSPEYAKAKARKYGAKPILQASGALEQSLAEGSGNTVTELWPTRMRWGTSLGYALYHQVGTRKMPARRIFDFIKPEDLRTLERSAMHWAATKERRLGFRILGAGAEPGAARLAGIAEYERIAATGAPLSIAGGEQFGSIAGGTGYAIGEW